MAEVVLRKRVTLAAQLKEVRGGNRTIATKLETVYIVASKVIRLGVLD